MPLYINFVKHLASSFNYTELIYQKIPTFRAHLVDNLGVGEWHKDRTYNHGTTEVNFWLPFTDTYDTNTIWVESKEDLGDYSPHNVKYGEILVFSGANLMHGNKINKTTDTRVSVDFRLVEPTKFIPNTEGSINMKTPFDIGGYFEKLSL
jgi:ectoine hydroxylase-related dioxygenase (phytanoyl-CoA dioxygenase family)